MVFSLNIYWCCRVELRNCVKGRDMRRSMFQECTIIFEPIDMEVLSASRFLMDCMGQPTTDTHRHSAKKFVSGKVASGHAVVLCFHIFFLCGSVLCSMYSNTQWYIVPCFSCGIDLWKCQLSDFTGMILMVILSGMVMVYRYESHFHFNFYTSKILEVTWWKDRWVSSSNPTRRFVWKWWESRLRTSFSLWNSHFWVLIPH